MGFVLRYLFAFILVAASYNPTQWNYFRWASENFSQQIPLTVLFGLLLFVGYVIFVRATLRSIGVFGMVLVIAIIGALIWVLSDYGLLSLDNSNAVTWVGIIAMAFVLGTGLCWSFIRRNLSGQYDVDDADS